MTKPDDGRPASVAVKDAADVLMLRWTAKRVGGDAEADARVLRCLNALDAIAEELGEVEQLRGRSGDGVGNRCLDRIKQALTVGIIPFVPEAAQ